jgi:hypothetical protein
MNSQNFQIECAKAIRLPQDWGHILWLILATFPMEEIKERLFNSQERKSGQKYLQKSRKWKIFQHKIGDDFIQTHGCIDANQEFTRCVNHHNILLLFGVLERSLTFSPHLSYTMKHTHTSQKQLWLRGGRGMIECLILSTNPWGPIYSKLMTKLPLCPNTMKTAKLG